MKKHLIPVIAILSITVLEISAMLAGMNGTMFALSLTMIGGLAGYEIKSLRG